MFYNSNNWNLIAKIIYELQKLTMINEWLNNFKSLEEATRENMLKRITLRLQTSGFPTDTDADVYIQMVYGIQEQDLPFYLMEALSYIDQKLIHQNQVRYFMYNYELSVSPMRQLNKNAKELGILILPKLYCSWSRKDGKLTELSVSRGINELMQYYYYIDTKSLEGLEVRNYLMKFPKPKEATGFLRIAVSPLTNGDVLAVKKYKARGGKKIAITGVGSDQVELESKRKVKKQFYVSKKDLENKVLKIVDKAAEIQADILMFPEMLGTREMRAKCLEKLAGMGIDEDEKNPPFITLLPTEWECRNPDRNARPWEAGNNVNTLYVACSGGLMDGDGYKATFMQQKQNPYLEKSAHLSGEVEDIQSDKVVHILHIPYLGRVAFPICADLLGDSYRKMLIEILGATLILCPSFSKGFDDFIQLTTAGSDSGCRIIWCDSCAVRHLYDKEVPGAFKESDICCTGAYGHRNYSPIKPYPNCKNGHCEALCLFYIDIPLSPFSVGDTLGELKWHHLIA